MNELLATSSLPVFYFTLCPNRPCTVDGADKKTFPITKLTTDFSFEQVVGPLGAGEHQLTLELVGKSEEDTFFVSFLEITEPLPEPSTDSLPAGFGAFAFNQLISPVAVTEPNLFGHLFP